GSVRMVPAAAGHVVAAHDYVPFGLEPAAAPDPAPLRYTGKERDVETALNYFGARYYASWLGRFTTVDPALEVEKAQQEPQQWNRYAYVTNNPMRFIDPDGRQEHDFLEHDIRALMAKKITVEEYNARIQARGVPAAVGALIMAGPTGWRGAVGCFLVPSCSPAAIR